jgi:type IV pilus assembly protein PilY1
MKFMLEGKTMFKSSLKRYIHLVCVFALTLASGTASADDTEIYFSSAKNTLAAAVRPNVLLILDSSGSMTSTVAGTGMSRIQIMKNAMNKILDSMEDVNVGLMRFTKKNGGPVLFPIMYIDGPAAYAVSEPNDLNPRYSYSISSGSDDAEEDIGSTVVTLADPVLDVSRVLTSSGTINKQIQNSVNDAYEYYGVTYVTGPQVYNWAYDQGNLITGVRFSGLSIPQGSTIISAKFQLYKSLYSGATTHVAGEAVDDAALFAQSSYDAINSAWIPNTDLSTRPLTTYREAWEFGGTDPEEKDVTGIIQEIVNRPGWSTGQALALLMYADTGDSGIRRFESYDTNAAKAPRLIVDYSNPGGVQDQLTGLRFPRVDIPQGATVTSAHLVLTPASTQSGATGAETWTVKAVSDDDTTTFTNTNGDISKRATTAASVNWTVPDTTVDTPVNSPDLSAVVQEVVNRSGWCGGNAMAFVISSGATALTRYFESFEGNPNVAPTLEVSYDATTGGCYRKTETAQINARYDDVEEKTDGTIRRTSSALDLSFNKTGVRFNAIDVPQGAKIDSATIDVNAYGSATSGNPQVAINGEAADDSASFTGSNGELSSRTLTTASALWDVPDFVTGNWYTTVDLKDVVQEIVNRSGWSSGNSMSFVFGTDVGKKDRQAVSYDTNPNQSPRLSITYEASGSTAKTVRERLKELVDQMPADDWTPIVETLYEAAHYWRGEKVKYGLTRDGERYTRVSHAGSYCDAAGSCNGADTASYPPYGVDTPSGCDMATNPDSKKCKDQKIEGEPSYISPFSSSLTCQSNYQVLLTDGEANSLDSSARDAIKSEFLGGSDCQTQKSDGTTISKNGERCGIDLAKFMDSNDQSSTLDNEQKVSTYTIGFNTKSLASATQYLKDMAAAGGGQFFEASTAGDLVSVFNVILSKVKNDPTSFVSPSLATNAFNRLLSRSEIYFGLFTPSLEEGWPGNVKKYTICTDTADNNNDGQPDCTLGEILDANSVSAIDPSSDKFKTTAESIWGGVVDGRETTLGGVGAETTDYTQTVIYTDATPGNPTTPPSSGTSLAFVDNPGYQIDINTWDDNDLSSVRGLVCPSASTATGSDCYNRMLWLLGKAITPEASDTSPTTRWTVNDVLHSSPQVITYGGADSNSDGVIDTFYDRLVVGTNDGGVRFINADTGKQEWEFLPESKLSQQRQLYDNPEGDHLYGLDVTPTLDVHDVNNDGYIDPSAGDYVHLIIGMRRGGNYIYALDVTPSALLTNNTTSITPKFLWRIDASTAGYSRLADTWSQPKLATIQTTSGFTRVIVFGGGYDANLDNGFGTAATSGSDNLGNAIYIADPSDGTKIMSISGTGSGADIEVPDMHDSIPSKITTLDSDGDGLIDRLYVGDTAGQVWRVDLNGDVKLTGSDVQGSTVVGRLANISVAGGVPPVSERRFFEPPAVVQVKDTIYSDAANGEYDYVILGTGNRAHPLNQDVSDRVYAFRDKFIDAMPDTDANNLADSGYPQAGGPITNADLVDVSTTVLDTSAATRGAMGWYYDFDSTGTDGEKVLSAPTVIAGSVFFTTYVPDLTNASDLCSAHIGGGFAYNINILTTKAAIDWDEDGTLEDVADRQKQLGGGIPSDVVPVFTKEGVVGIVGVEGGASQLGQLTGLPRYRTYWYEEN